jgi:protein-tyrosine phosphatase
MERSITKASITANKPLKLEGAHNLRDLGGYPTRDGRITASGRFLRSDGTGTLSEGDVAKLLSMGLKLVVDLRSPSEAEALPSRLRGLDGLRYLHLPLIDHVQSGDLAGNFPDSMAKLYVSLMDEGKARMREIFEALAEADGLRLFNCTAGKDRTGVVAMLLLELAGVGKEAIIADYATSAANMAGLFERQAAALRARGVKVPAYLFESNPGDMEQAVEHLFAVYGSAAEYLATCGVAQPAIDRLLRLLVEDAM